MLTFSIVVFAILGAWLLPNVPGKEKPKGSNLALLPFQRCMCEIYLNSRETNACQL